jgi:hypothetical protein
MKIFILLNVLIFILSKKHDKPNDCINYGCDCVGSWVIFKRRPTCPNEATRSCYAKTKCKRQKDGRCGYKQTNVLRQCLSKINSGPLPDPIPDPESRPSRPKLCQIGGCGGEICSENPMFSLCLYKPQHDCYKATLCEPQLEGGCGWTMTPELQSCLNQPIDTQIDPPIY